MAVRYAIAAICVAISGCALNQAPAGIAQDLWDGLDWGDRYWVANAFLRCVNDGVADTSCLQADLLESAEMRGWPRYAAVMLAARSSSTPDPAAGLKAAHGAAASIGGDIAAMENNPRPAEIFAHCARYFPDHAGAADCEAFWLSHKLSALGWGGMSIDMAILRRKDIRERMEGGLLSQTGGDLEFAEFLHATSLGISADRAARVQASSAASAAAAAHGANALQAIEAAKPRPISPVPIR